jgi:hypothetical protein
LALSVVRTISGTKGVYVRGGIQATELWRPFTEGHQAGAALSVTGRYP